MVQKIDLGGNGTAFNIESLSDESVQAMGPKFESMPVYLVCPGPNKLHFYFADDLGPLSGTTGNVEIYSRSQHDLETHRGHLQSIHRDPSLMIKPSLTAWSDKSPAALLADMRTFLMAPATKRKEHSDGDERAPLVIYALQLDEAQDRLDVELLSIERTDGQEIVLTETRAAREKLEIMAAQSSDLQNSTKASIAAFTDVALLMAELSVERRKGRLDAAQLNGNTLWKDVQEKREALIEARAAIRQGLLER